MEKKNKKQLKLKDDAIKMAKLFNHDPAEVYAFADDANMPEDIMPVYEEMPVEEAEVEVPVVDEIEDMIKKLKEIADKPDIKEDVKKQANELIARLEELKTAKQNAQDFIAENEVVEAPKEAETAEQAAAPATA